MSRRTPHRAPDYVADPDAVVEASAVRRDLRHAGTNAGAARGDPLSWLKPKRPGDTLSVMSEIIEITPSRSRARRNV
jgi:acyl dehydratase